MDIIIKIEGIEEFTESMALLASAIAYDKGMKKTATLAKELVPEVTKSASTVTESEEKVAESKSNVTKTEEKETKAEIKITIEDVRAAFMAKNSKNNTPKLKKILNDFGVKKVTDLKEEDFEAVLKELEAI